MKFWSGVFRGLFQNGGRLLGFWAYPAGQVTDQNSPQRHTVRCLIFTYYFIGGTKCYYNLASNRNDKRLFTNKIHFIVSQIVFSLVILNKHLYFFNKQLIRLVWNDRLSNNYKELKKKKRLVTTYSMEVWIESQDHHKPITCQEKKTFTSVRNLQTHFKQRNRSELLGKHACKRPTSKFIDKYMHSKALMSNKINVRSVLTWEKLFSWLVICITHSVNRTLGTSDLFGFCYSTYPDGFV